MFFYIRTYVCIYTYVHTQLHVWLILSTVHTYACTCMCMHVCITNACLLWCSLVSKSVCRSSLWPRWWPSLHTSFSSTVLRYIRTYVYIHVVHTCGNVLCVHACMGNILYTLLTCVMCPKKKRLVWRCPKSRVIFLLGVRTFLIFIVSTACYSFGEETIVSPTGIRIIRAWMVEKKKNWNIQWTHLLYWTFLSFFFSA